MWRSVSTTGPTLAVEAAFSLRLGPSPPLTASCWIGESAGCVTCAVAAPARSAVEDVPEARATRVRLARRTTRAAIPAMPSLIRTTSSWDRLPSPSKVGPSTPRDVPQAIRDSYDIARLRVRFGRLVGLAGRAGGELSTAEEEGGHVWAWPWRSLGCVLGER